MNSSNDNQTGDHHENLSGNAAVAKVREIADKAKSCFFCTSVSSPGPSNARPMSVQKVDDDGNIWFLSAKDSHKNAELQTDPSARLFFQGSPHSDFLQLEGRATISTDRAMIDELWEPIAKNWFTEGKDDPRITVIRFEPSEGYYWDTKHGYAVAGVKMMLGAVTGKTKDDSVEGRVRL
jgi:general stress protein 26